MEMAKVIEWPDGTRGMVGIQDWRYEKACGAPWRKAFCSGNGREMIAGVTNGDGEWTFFNANVCVISMDVVRDIGRAVCRAINASWMDRELVDGIAENGTRGAADAGNRTPPRDFRWDLPCDVDPVPCRYCGGRGPSLGVVRSILGDFAVECDCTVRGPSGITPKHAIELWNKMQKGIGNG